LSPFKYFDFKQLQSEPKSPLLGCKNILTGTPSHGLQP